jgi:hypothetical protein
MSHLLQKYFKFLSISRYSIFKFSTYAEVGGGGWGEISHRRGGIAPDPCVHRAAGRSLFIEHNLRVAMARIQQRCGLICRCVTFAHPDPEGLLDGLV